MVKIILLVTFFLLIACVSPNQNKGETQRIISLAPNITEILFSLGLQDHIVGVSDFCTFPKEAMEKESIGGLFNPDLEKITALKPDLILATESYQGLADKLGKERFNIVLLPEKTIEDMYVTIDSIGMLTNTSEKAKILVASIKDSMDIYNAKTTQYRPSAILVLGRNSGTTRNIGISGPGAFVNELWEWSGGKNAFSHMLASFAQINREDLLIVNPEIIIEFKSNKNWGLDQDIKNKAEWRDLHISAVKNNHIFVIPGNHFLIPGPRMYLLAREYSSIILKYRLQNLE